LRTPSKLAGGGDGDWRGAPLWTRSVACYVLRAAADICSIACNACICTDVISGRALSAVCVSQLCIEILCIVPETNCIA
jgi:hypothetical protein